MTTTDTAPRNPAQDLGRRGENLAADYLTERGLVVLSRNWRCRDGELDIVATDGSTLVVCEVKTRSTEAEVHDAQKNMFRGNRQT